MNPLVLVADDDADNRAIAAAVLKAAGFRVALACDGAAALELAGTERPDLVLMDMGMPVLDGWEAVRRLKSMPGLASVPVLAFTAFALAGDAQRAARAGCDDFIAKPCVPADLVARVRGLLNRGGSNGEAQRTS